MATINSNYNKLSAGYLFPEIGRRVRLFLSDNPGVKVMRLGIGNTTEPLTPTVIAGLKNGVERLAPDTTEGALKEMIENGITVLKELDLKKI